MNNYQETAFGGSKHTMRIFNYKLKKMDFTYLTELCSLYRTLIRLKANIFLKGKYLSGI